MEQKVVQYSVPMDCLLIDLVLVTGLEDRVPPNSVLVFNLELLECRQDKGIVMKSATVMGALMSVEPSTLQGMAILIAAGAIVSCLMCVHIVKSGTKTHTY